MYSKVLLKAATLSGTEKGIFCKWIAIINKHKKNTILPFEYYYLLLSS